MGLVRVLADQYLQDFCALEPSYATYYGQAGHDHELPDLSPDGVAARVDLARLALAAIERAQADDVEDRRCADLAIDRLGLDVEQFEAGEHLRALRSSGSPVQGLRECFDLMPTETEEHWATVVQRMNAVPEAYRQYRASLEAGMSVGLMAPVRQALACASQLSTWAGAEPGAVAWFDSFIAPGPELLQQQLHAAAQRASAGLADTATWLRTVYASAAEGTADAVGGERYRLQARVFLGAVVDATEAYDWGWGELERIETDMRATADEILPGESLPDVFAHLDRYGPAIEGEQNLRSFLQDLVDHTIDALGSEHFTIPEPLRRCEVMLAPPGPAAQYYTPPTPDFSRPGRTWNPTNGRTHFPIWNEVSTCYHEAVPGHHLQLAQWVHRADQLSRYQSGVEVSGTIEGWALYAERLMDELGYLTDPGRRLGYLVAQQLRATRVIVDIGMHHELTFPAGQPFHAGEEMTAELGREFLRAHAGSNMDFLESEWLRYLGLPGQAISYKLGERVWRDGREAARRRVTSQGRTFDLRAWHAEALDMGSVGLDALAAVLPTLG